MRSRTRYCFTGLVAGALVLTVQGLVASGAAPPAATPAEVRASIVARRAAALDQQENRARFLQLLAPRPATPSLAMLMDQQILLARTLSATRQASGSPGATIAVAGLTAGRLATTVNRPGVRPTSTTLTPLQRLAQRRMSILQAYSRRFESRETYLRSLTPRNPAQAVLISRAILQSQRQQTIASARIAIWGRIAATPIRPGG